MPPRHVVVVGSVNQDIVLSVPAMPQGGATLLAISSRLSAGGKGANQAVAAARSGAVTEFVCIFGADAASEDLRRSLEREGVILGAYAESSKPSGRAIVLVDPSGENCIVVDRGANSDLTAGLVSTRLQHLKAGDVVVVQCEIGTAAVEAALRAGHEMGATVVLNLAPFRQLSQEALSSATVIIVNEGEAADLTAKEYPLGDPAAAAQLIARTYNSSCIITLGGRGSVVAENEDVRVVPAAPVRRVVDTTGAGDAFVGTLAAGLATGNDLLAATHLATTAAARTVTTLGAQSFPTKQESSYLVAGRVADTGFRNRSTI
ncbi:ribokinase [bacterium RCC_150]